MSGIRRYPAHAQRMARAAEAFLASLEPEQRAAVTAPYDVADHRSWTYLPGPRPGLMLADMTEAQQTRALELLDTGCGPTGARTARAIIELDAILRGEAKRGHYWLRILGEPSAVTPWAWRINGHHLGLHLTVVGDGVAVTPNFFGAQPATVLDGPHRGLRTLPGEEKLARALLSSLDPEQRRVAIAAPVAPPDILTRSDPVADPGALTGGLEHARMYGEQRHLLRELIGVYVDRAPVDVAASYWQGLTDAGRSSRPSARSSRRRPWSSPPARRPRWR